VLDSKILLVAPLCVSASQILIGFIGRRYILVKKKK
jgi:hypothetical protein